ncbi:hypothetical protein HG535_0A03560 [Zygotorulaspora mrakii]|uniref:C2H2-type domain-containing protein n=1 Tax=Zygotorulaspora mrakii TaxID=42260 RepID=A0A7H9AWA0_ZYGMR|nr:uncharacterized protein HG535_0A03560 [Zygotorulaspora mrakii]QLG70417.1 hypothetical protein HG535_0A03560 [Zygotorulaspora mrakii]
MMFGNDCSVLVLPSPNVNSHGMAMSGNYPIMCSHADVSGQKHFTLLPPLTNSQLIDNDLKYKLNRYSFSIGSSSDTSASTPATSPVSRAMSNSHIHDHDHVHVHDLFHNSEYTVAAPRNTRNESTSSLAGSDAATANSYVLRAGTTLNSKHIVRKDSPRELQSEILRQQPPVKVEQRRRYVCKVCSKAFTTSGHLARHNRIHTGEKNHICPFEGCNQRFSRHDNCIQHYKTHFKKKASS